MSTLETISLFAGQLVLEEDFQFGYAVTLKQNHGKPIMKGVGSSPKKAVEDLVSKWEKG